MARYRLFQLLGWTVSVALLYPSTARSDEAGDLFDGAREAARQQNWDQVIELNGRLLQLKPNLAGSYVNLAQAYLNKKDYDTAIGCCNTALSFDPGPDNAAAAYGNRAAAYFEKGNRTDADTDFKRAVEASPTDPAVWYGLGELALRKQAYATAVTSYKKALQIKPDLPMAYSDLAWILATCPDQELRDGLKAWEYAKQACELEPETPLHMDTLAAAFAECKDFTQAVHWEEKAIDADTRESDLKAFRGRLELYKQKQPYRAEAK